LLSSLYFNGHSNDVPFTTLALVTAPPTAASFEDGAAGFGKGSPFLVALSH
jgi:hypothetical protein